MPGIGTEQLISRKDEKKVYETIEPYQISDKIIYFDELSGVKIVKYYDKSQIIDPENREEVKKAIIQLKQFHSLGLKVDHHFDLKERLQYYNLYVRKTKQVIMLKYQKWRMKSSPFKRTL